MTESAMIDWAQIKSLKGDLGDGFDELVEVFLDEVDAAMAALDPDAAPRDQAAALHFLKGSALNLGFAAFAALCAQGEQASMKGGRVDLGPIRASFAESRAEFVQGLAARRAA
jgi:HPt (histidine-containing phosphotransfer) domain-containing protein